MNENAEAGGEREKNDNAVDVKQSENFIAYRF